MVDMSTHHLGWNETHEQAFTNFRAEGLEPARVAREERGRYLLLGERGTFDGELSGRFRHQAQSRTDLPAVGDWVAVRPGESQSVIVGRLPRASVFMRQAAGDTTEAQVIAVNVDTVFLVTGLDGDFNLRRIERYLVAAWESGAAPVVVLNKADLESDVEARTLEVEAIAPGVPVVAVSALAREGLTELEPWLVPGKTVALLGSSGVGKSTLINALAGEDRQATGAVRADDSRGRHTTTHRELVLLPSGAVLLDTPGMRELQLWGDDSGLEGAFPDIATLAESCRFRDCQHTDEPGCAVNAAVANGTLELERLESWRKLQRELRWLAVRQDARARAEQQAKWKAIAKSMKHHPKADRWR
jgi:ribosome biogenesis GTPase / thiamine phosphate phosphatase